MFTRDTLTSVTERVQSAELVLKEDELGTQRHPATGGGPCSKEGRYMKVYIVVSVYACGCMGTMYSPVSVHSKKEAAEVACEALNQGRFEYGVQERELLD